MIGLVVDYLSRFVNGSTIDEAFKISFKGASLLNSDELKNAEILAKSISGDGDFLTADALWDFKVSKSNITTAHTLQLMIYYLMGIHSIHNEFNSITNIGVFNPRLNIVYMLDVSKIPEALISEIETEIIGY